MTNVRLPHARKVRHRRFRGFDRGMGHTYRSRYFRAWVCSQADRLTAGAPVSQNFLPFNVPNLFNSEALFGHGLSSGDGPYRVQSTGTIPGGLDGGTDYYVNVVTANDVTLHLSMADGISGANIVDFTDDGTGVITLNQGGSATKDDVLDAMKEGNVPRTILAADDVADLT